MSRLIEEEEANDYAERIQTAQALQVEKAGVCGGRAPERMRARDDYGPLFSADRSLVTLTRWASCGGTRCDFDGPWIVIQSDLERASANEWVWPDKGLQANVAHVVSVELPGPS